MSDLIPLFVDLDGTVIKEDIGQLALKKHISNNFFSIIGILIRFLMFGKPNVKFHVSKNYNINFDEIHFNQSCLDFIETAKKSDRKVYLISGSHELAIKKITDKLNIFDGVYGTTKNYNMISLNKVKFIHQNLGILKFDYIGNSHQDLPVWEYSENVIYTNVDEGLHKKINLINKNKIFIKPIFI